jgi:hypothetical protein
MKSLDLTIPKPCHEKWTSFNPTAHGGFCSSCQKEVIDFTTWSDEDIYNYFKNKPGSACGRFKNLQLKTYLPVSIPSKPMNKWLPASILSMTLLFSSRESFAQTERTRDTPLVSLTMGDAEITQRIDSAGTKKITGVVRDDADQSPIPGVNVELKGTNLKTVTDVEGKYVLETERPQNDATLVFSFIGYATEEVSVSSSRVNNIELQLDITGEIIVLGGVCATRRFSPRSMWWKFKRIFRK